MYVRTGSPYDSRMVRLIGLKIYDQLMKTGIYVSKGQRNDKPLDKDDLTDEAREGLVFTFKASPGWYKNFMKRNF